MGKYIKWGKNFDTFDWSDVTEWHPVNKDIIPNDSHDYSSSLPSNREAKKVLSNPIVDRFISTDPQSTEIEKNEFIIAHDDGQ